MKPKTTNQSGTGGKSAKQNTNTGSGSRPKGGSYPLQSTAPKNAQKLRG